MDILTAKIIALVLFFIVPVGLGVLSLYLYNRYSLKLHDSKKGRTFFSYLNCFAGGFFLGTCLLGVLGEGMAKFEEYRHLVNLDYRFPFFEIGIGVGFFLVALTEKLIHTAFSRKRHPECDDDSCDEDDEETRKRKKMQRLQSVTSNESEDDLFELVEDLETTSTKQILPEFDTEPKHTKGYNETEGMEHKAASSSSKRIHKTQDRNRKLFHAAKNKSEAGKNNGRKEPEEGNRMSLMRVVLLLLALSFHTVFDGLAVGLQTDVTKVLTLMLAIGFHKSIMSVVLVVELAAVLGTQKPHRPLLGLLLFSLASPLGLGIGMGLTSGEVDHSAQLLMGAVLQAIAAGVFLYVTCFEILERDMASRHERAVLRVLTAMFGFFLISALETAIH